MAPHQRRNLLAHRRRVEDEGEDEEGSLAGDVEDDSLSEGSVLSNAEDDADGEESGTSDDGLASPHGPAKVNGHSNGLNIETNKTELSKSGSPKKTNFVPTADTEAMMNGLKVDNPDSVTAIDFEDMTTSPNQVTITSQVPSAAPPVNTRLETIGEKRRREHEEYKKKRDSDPSFVPNRGMFFMHDSRSIDSNSNGFRPSVRGRPRGRGFNVNFIPGSNNNSGPSKTQWTHDLHETVAQHTPPVPKPSTTLTGTRQAPIPAGRELSTSQHKVPSRSFSRSTPLAKVTVRVSLPGMTFPTSIPDVPVNQHTRLPQHRPPLRRDKPVRISIPNNAPRYIFPSTERSFIFIPRALRPNQQGFHRGRGRGNISSYGSRRTSAYGGSTYTPSIAMSRRSSVGRAASREGFASPTGSVLSRPPMSGMDPAKPIVRLPLAVAPQSVPPPMTNAASPAVVSMPPVQGYPAPQVPPFRENRPIPLEMHQPRPQKTVSVTNIESPGDTFTFNPPQQQLEQPFHHQVPPQVNGSTFAGDPSAYPPHSRHPSHQSLLSGTPLSQIPERAIHAQPFQPYAFPQPPRFYPGPYPPMYFYSPAGTDSPNYAGPSATAPPFVPGAQPAPIMVPSLPPGGEQTGQPSTFAVESNGMVHYLTSSQVYDGAPSGSYPPPGYVMPQTGGVVGIGGMMTPPGAYYYPPPDGVYYHSQ